MKQEQFLNNEISQFSAKKRIYRGSRSHYKNEKGSSLNSILIEGSKSRKGGITVETKRITSMKQAIQMELSDQSKNRQVQEWL